MKHLTIIKIICLMLAVLSLQAQAQYSKITYIHSDSDGTPFAATNQQGGVEWQIDHYPYGDEYDNTSVDRKSDISFAGKAYDEEIGLSYFGERWYDPAVGRFTGVDPAAVNSNDYRNFNRYVYGNNNPYRYVDPDGRDAEIIHNKNGSININIPISFSGPGAIPQNISFVKQDISKVWSGNYQINGKTTPVSVNVTTPKPGGPSNSIILTNGPTSKKACGGCSFVRGGNSGEWNMNSRGMKLNEAAHEGGHLMGEPDRYSSTLDSKGNRIATPPNSGFKGNIMAQNPGKADSRNMSKILKSKNNTVKK